MKQWLITGGAGFIGSHIVEKLVHDGHRVVVLDTCEQGNKIPEEIRDKVDLHIADIRDAAAVRKAIKGCDGVYHMAAKLGVEVVAEAQVETMEIEALGCKNITDAMFEENINRIVYASTSAVYGKHLIDKAVDEQDMVAPVSSYAVAKRYNEIYLSMLHLEKGMKSASVRLFNVYGPRQDDRMVIPRFIDQAIRGEALSVYGNGEQTRDFTYVTEVADILIALMENIETDHIFNIARGSESTIHNLANKIVGIADNTSHVSYIEPPIGRHVFEVHRRWGDSERLFDLVGIRPTIDLDEGLQKTFDWEVARREHN